MIVSNGPFIGYVANQTSNFCGGDSEKTFLQNLPLQRRDWHYRSAHISYDHNSLGHRCKNYKDIDLENFSPRFLLWGECLSVLQICLLIFLDVFLQPIWGSLSKK